jgi:hypothetical protein
MLRRYGKGDTLISVPIEAAGTLAETDQASAFIGG